MAYGRNPNTDLEEGRVLEQTLYQHVEGPEILEEFDILDKITKKFNGEVPFRKMKLGSNYYSFIEYKETVCKGVGKTQEEADQNVCKDFYFSLNTRAQSLLEMQKISNNGENLLKLISEVPPNLKTEFKYIEGKWVCNLKMDLVTPDVTKETLAKLQNALQVLQENMKADLEKGEDNTDSDGFM